MLQPAVPAALAPGNSALRPARVIAMRMAIFALALVLAFSGLTRVRAAAQALEGEQTVVVQIFEIKHKHRHDIAFAARRFARAQREVVKAKTRFPGAADYRAFASVVCWVVRGPPRARAPPLIAA